MNTKTKTAECIFGQQRQTTFKEHRKVSPSIHFKFSRQKRSAGRHIVLNGLGCSHNVRIFTDTYGQKYGLFGIETRHRVAFFKSIFDRCLHPQW